MKLMASETILINRAPVLTRWASVAAERLGFNEDEALTLGKALAGLTAQTKGRRLGISSLTKRNQKRRGRNRWARSSGFSFVVDRCLPRILRMESEPCVALK
jgi:hypothetical protein